MRILLTNDDGIDGPGLHALARALKAAGHDILIVAPAVDHSGFGAALGPLHVTGQVSYEDRQIEALLDVPAFALDGSPALCVFSTVLGGFGATPDLVVSGINAGQNQGRAVLFSGTVGAALTACQFGVPGMAVSMAKGADDEWHWDTAAACAAALVDSALEVGTAGVINVNVPNVRPHALRGFKTARLATGGNVQTSMVEKEPGTLELSFERFEPEPGTDVALLREGYVTLSLLAVARDIEDSMLDDIVKRLANEQLAR
jgi:5'-nucleotidase